MAVKTGFGYYLAIIMVIISGGDLLSEAEGSYTPRNIIIMISDGGGYNHVDAASLYEYGTTGVQVYEGFPVQLAMSTYSVLGNYNPDIAWTYFNYFTLMATDSAGAATTMSTGIKTYDGYLGMGTDIQPIEHIIEVCEDLGMATGVITSMVISHATPAGFSVHHTSRLEYSVIAQKMIYESGLDVIMGCGHPFYDHNGIYTGDGFYHYVGEATWTDLLNGTAGGDADGDGIADAWTLIQTRQEFQDLMSGETPQRVCGIAQVDWTLQQTRGGDFNAGPFEVAFIETVPTLEEMTVGALNVLDNDPNGFFLMVEGGAVDQASHNNESGRMIEEEIDFNRSVEAVVDWVQTNSSWEETLVIVTADHECGYLTGPGSGELPEGPVWNPLVNNGAGVQPGMQWNHWDHTNMLVPFYAKGCGACSFDNEPMFVDTVRGLTIDNTSIGRVFRQLLKQNLVMPYGIGLEDFGYLSGRWLMDGCEDLCNCEGADLDESGVVDVSDLLFLMEDWLNN
ncbi:MAG: alkaline phosphatase [Sedimentisphaerales bacterium]|nr:alkaline phosphatase [Sedimentisphaerales bacterium]